ncbi:MAG: tRNA (adenosine(37)-N6)-threonylcarbamoyltransferase complex ATPase subunit type 1 TsaE [Flavobacteriales bacterium]|nr:MAG: tRNA (adenosine(37)-N6)-threonylcarbamoyltransferase complex ATPase subunit type 1 TsaE [Flavobacteriales bacterium]PIE48754.1 MAG: tRNA (adenosine(37)-N6)-threonylcarbamoyltransferase complex ATPase subunit type 1 TsaE [Flavobacteriales bacterium]
MQKTYQLSQISEVVSEIISKIKSNVILFYGKMGVGKTTLIKELVQQLGSTDTASSPTFSLVNEYLTASGKHIYHFDFYRINTEEEAMDMGIEEYFYSGNLCLIEWPDKIKNLLPLTADIIQLSQNEDNTRTITLNQL